VAHHDRALDLLVRARKAARVTQASLAETHGRPQSFVAKHESGERRLDAAEFIGVARAIGQTRSNCRKRLSELGANSERRMRRPIVEQCQIEPKKEWRPTPIENLSWPGQRARRPTRRGPVRAHKEGVGGKPRNLSIGGRT